MNVKQLMIPRLICISNYLGNTFPLSECISFDDVEPYHEIKEIPLIWKKEFNDYAYEDCSRVVLLSKFLEYRQFKVLRWWENRRIDELPKNLKCIKSKEYVYFDYTNNKRVDINEGDIIEVDYYERKPHWNNDTTCYHWAIRLKTEIPIRGAIIETLGLFAPI